LNIWVCDLGPQVAGFAFPPGSPANQDGVVIHYANFGRTGTVQADYDLGRTTTHEVGHWFNLLHPWGANENCFNDDEVSDTPQQGVIYEKCPTPPQSSCGSEDMLSNFMGYVYDRCMGNFTEGQKERMRQAIVNARTSLILSKGCVPVGLEENKLENLIRIWPNPSSKLFNFELSSTLQKTDLKFKIYNALGQEIRVKTIESENGYTLNLEDRKGLYFVHFEYQGAQLSKKLILD
jgi:hypothetical protein